jgi:hypothetical protein
MGTTVALRIASILSLLTAAGHTLGGRSSWSPVGENDTLRAMQSFHMNVFGVSRTYHDFFMGFGYSISIYLLLQTVVLWLLASLTKRDLKSARPFIAAFLLASVALVILSWVFIFPIPAACFALVTVCLVVSYVLALRSQRPARV